MRLWSSVCAKVCSSCCVFAVMIKVVSSAYVYTFEFGTVRIMLFMYSRKKVVERVLPCGIPCVIVCVCDCAFWVCSDCLRFRKYEAKNCSVSGRKLNSCFSLFMSFVCDMVSYALERSIYIASVGLCFSVWVMTLSIIVCSASVQFECGLNAYCVGEMMSCLVRWFMSCWLIMVSSSFAIIGSRDIGL